MDLTVWSSTPKSAVLSALAPIMGGRADFPIRVVDDIKDAAHDAVVLALGKEPKEVLEACKIVHKGSTITSNRGAVKKLGNRSVLVSYSPGIQFTDYGKYVDLLCDARMAARMALTGKYEPQLGHYEYVDDFRAMIAEVRTQYAATGRAVRVSHDTETIGLDPWFKGDLKRPAARFVTLQFSHRVGYSAVKYFNSAVEWNAWLACGGWEQLQFLFNSEMVSLWLSNGKYDLTWHWVHTRHLVTQLPIECTNFKMDTTLVGRVRQDGGQVEDGPRPKAEAPAVRGWRHRRHPPSGRGGAEADRQGQETHGVLR